MYFKTLIFFFGNQKSLHYCQLTETRQEAPRTKALRKREKETGVGGGKANSKGRQEDRTAPAYSYTAERLCSASNSGTGRARFSQLELTFQKAIYLK